MEPTTAALQIALGPGGHVQVALRQADGRHDVQFQLDGAAEPCVLHWGMAQGRARWLLPPSERWPAGTRPFDAHAVQTPFPSHPGSSTLTIAFDQASTFDGIDFVLFLPASGRWENNGGRDYRVSWASPASAEQGPSADANLEQRIVERERGSGSWTLMHRFDLCFDLLDRVPSGDVARLVLLFVWLRFSAIRQLDWQRNYNTKPRELAHAQDRLTVKLADRYVRNAGERGWLRLIMSTVGRGGEGQRVRDEVLNIMHRHHIKEVSGHFMEEWHQKLHNNTTPDDVVICEAYLAFLQSDGRLDVFYRTLEEAGVTRDRLRSYERPIRSDPDFLPWLKDALIHEFEAFLHILRKLHSGTDLGAALEDARGELGASLAGDVDWIWRHHDDATPADVLAARIVAARRSLADRLEAGPEGHEARALLYLDLALEELLRLSVERQVHRPAGVDHIGALIAALASQVGLAAIDDELAACRRQWERVRTAQPRDADWALQAASVMERMARIVAAALDDFQRQLQPAAERLGRGLGVDQWAIASFGEEVIRGRAAVVLPVLARLLRQALSREWRLPAWQVVSPGRASGELVAVESLESVQATRFAQPTVILASQVRGHEEMPQGATGIVTPDEVDVLSHVGIRARNAGVLLATCHDADEIARVRSLVGQRVIVAIGAGGQIVIEPVTSPVESQPASTRRGGRPGLTSGGFTSFAIIENQFDAASVGSKALNLWRLRGKLPEWIRLPRSVAIPFGVFDRVLDDVLNAAVAKRYRDLVNGLSQRRPPPAEAARLLEDLRALTTTLVAPEGMQDVLRAAMEAEQLGWPNWSRAWSCITRVWASKWNDRAFLSREANLIDHRQLAMSVLIQPVVEADYAFVIHTTNPTTGASDEIYAEVVVGLGETLVGNHPGRAFSFTARKGDGRASVQAFPAKSTGLFGGGVIFRSDSNAEDLSGYAGAGLYDSITLAEPREVLLDYTDNPLVQDESFRRTLAAKVTEIGLAVEQGLGGAQDIEGAVAGNEWYVVQARPQVGLVDA